MENIVLFPTTKLLILMVTKKCACSKCERPAIKYDLCEFHLIIMNIPVLKNPQTHSVINYGTHV